MKEIENFIKEFNQEHNINYDRFCDLVNLTGFAGMPQNREELDICLEAIEVEVRSNIDTYGELLEFFEPNR